MSGTEEAASRLRALPQLDSLLRGEAAEAMRRGRAAARVTSALRWAVAEERRRLLDGGAAGAEGGIEAAALARLQAEEAPGLRGVINGTGIVLHTNLGRAPLAELAVEAVAAMAGGYCDLEFDLATGARGRRGGAIERMLCRLTGAEAALVVNNGAAAILLALTGLAASGEVIVSRGELVEIGGGFRIPEVIEQGGARLVEVGTTNRTRLADYARAVTPASRVLLRVHQSNYRIIGFTEATPLAALAALARERGLMLVEDLGSGSLVPLAGATGSAEPTVQEAVAAGADVVTFSGDKLLGGPQAGMLVGRAEAIDRLRRHPLMRALRADKLCLAALDATLRLYAEGQSEAVPVLRMLAQPVAVLRARAERVAAALPAAMLYRIEPSTARAGGGALPEAALPSVAVGLAVEGVGAEALAAALRAGSPPVVGRIADGLVLLDVIAIADDELRPLGAAIEAACRLF